ncbi:hypothetical protein HK100_004157 [Physocladia obscura]|uniref:Uncharacterized protein n=1 Tax=Physocladia obscura TaxID=109957 RepID=A0AAD5STD7_9FUNG|nr:hypothetical protein HK100_004157 [Physocladia obscura]
MTNLGTPTPPPEKDKRKHTDDLCDGTLTDKDGLTQTETRDSGVGLTDLLSLGSGSGSGSVELDFDLSSSSSSTSSSLSPRRRIQVVAIASIVSDDAAHDADTADADADADADTRTSRKGRSSGGGDGECVSPQAPKTDALFRAGRVPSHSHSLSHTADANADAWTPPESVSEAEPEAAACVSFAALPPSASSSASSSSSFSPATPAAASTPLKPTPRPKLNPLAVWLSSHSALGSDDGNAWDDDGGNPPAPVPAAHHNINTHAHINSHDRKNDKDGVADRNIVDDLRDAFDDSAFDASHSFNHSLPDSDNVTAELIDIPIPATLFSTAAQRPGVWSYDWDDTSHFSSRISPQQPHQQTFQTSFAKIISKLVQPLRISVETGKHYSFKSKTSHLNNNFPPNTVFLQAHNNNNNNSPTVSATTTVTSTTDDNSDKTESLQNSLLTTTSKQPQTNPIEPYKQLLDKTTPHLQDLIRSLQSLPTGLHLSLSAHTSLALATVIESLATARFVRYNNNNNYGKSSGTTSSSDHENTDDSNNGDTNDSDMAFDAARVAGSLRDLSAALNAAADGIVGVRSEGFVSVRGIVRVWGGGVDRLEGFLENSGRLLVGIDGRRRQGQWSGDLGGGQAGESAGRNDEYMCCDDENGCGTGGSFFENVDYFVGLFRTVIEWLIGGESSAGGNGRATASAAGGSDSGPENKDRFAWQEREWSKNVQQLSMKMLDVLEETDVLLQALETSIFFMLERTSIVHSIWQGANGVAHRERQKILSIAQDLRSDLEELKSQQQNVQSGKWIRRLTQWILPNTTTVPAAAATNTMNRNNNNHQHHHHQHEQAAKATERMLRRVEDDMDMLGKVVSSLKDIAPGVIEIGYRVKEMRVGVQKFRGDLKAAEVVGDVGALLSLVGWRDVAKEGEKDVESMKALLGQLGEAFGSFRNGAAAATASNAPVWQ